MAISAGEEGEDPSSSSLRPDKGNCVDNGGGGDGALNRGRVNVGLLRSGDMATLSDEVLRWYVASEGLLECECDE